MEQEFAFKLVLGGVTWDVYRFIKDGKPGTIAFTLRDDGTWHIGVLRSGTLSEDEVRQALLRN